jgi:hypothetical protein
MLRVEQRPATVGQIRRDGKRRDCTDRMQGLQLSKTVASPAQDDVPNLKVCVRFSKTGFLVAPSQD